MHLEKAKVHYKLREFDGAVAEFKEAFRLKPVPGLLFNIAQAERMRGNLKEARFYYEQYLRDDKNAPNRSEVLLQIEELDALVREQERESALRALAALPAGEPSSPAPVEPKAAPIVVSAPVEPQAAPVVVSAPVEPQAAPIVVSAPVEPKAAPIAVSAPVEPKAAPIAVSAPVEPKSVQIAVSAPVDQKAAPIVVNTPVEPKAAPPMVVSAPVGPKVASMVVSAPVEQPPAAASAPAPSPAPLVAKAPEPRGSVPSTPAGTAAEVKAPSKVVVLTPQPVEPVRTEALIVERRKPPLSRRHVEPESGSVVPYVFVAAAAVAAGAGAYFGLVAKQTHAQADKAPFQSDAIRLSGDARSSALTANVCFGAAGAAGIIGIMGAIAW